MRHIKPIEFKQINFQSGITKILHLRVESETTLNAENYGLIIRYSEIKLKI